MRLRVLTAAVVVLVTACSGSDGDEPEVADADQAPVRSITVPPGRLSPFCQAMIELDDSLPDDPSIDSGEQILAAYRDALPDVPPEIAVQFAAVIDALERGTEATLPPTTPASIPQGSGDAETPPGTSVAATENTFDEEGYLPDESPAAQVNAYIDFVCRGVANNPGPPPTEPDAPIITTADDG